MPHLLTKFGRWYAKKYINRYINILILILIIVLETPQLLQLVSNELNEVFSNSQPEPINIEWSEGQSVIVQYHLDNMWYRGTIIKVCIIF